MYNSQFCEEHNKPETQVWYKTCTNVWPAVQTAIRKVHDLRCEIDQIYEEEFPAIIPNYKVGPIQEPHQLNKYPTVSRKKRFITDIIGLGIQAFSAISQHRKQSKLQKSTQSVCSLTSSRIPKVLSLVHVMQACVLVCVLVWVPWQMSYTFKATRIL